MSQVYLKEINLTRKDLHGRCSNLPFDAIVYYSFSIHSMPLDHYENADKVVFTDNDGSVKVLKDKYATENK